MEDEKIFFKTVIFCLLPRLLIVRIFHHHRRENIMGKVIIKGIKENGCFDTELISTAALVTELIAKFPKMCEADVTHSLEEIRNSAEMDDRIRRTYVEVMKQRKNQHHDNNDNKQIVMDGIDAAKKCFEKHHDVKSGLTILKMCKLIGGEKFSIEVSEDEP